MHKCVLLIATMLSVLSPNIARAQNNDDVKIEVGDYAPDLEAKEWIFAPGEEHVPSLAVLRGLVVVVFFWVSWHEGGDAVLKFVNQFEHNQGLGKTRGVYTIGLTTANRKTTKPLLEKHKVFFPVGVKAREMAEEYSPT